MIIHTEMTNGGYMPEGEVAAYVANIIDCGLQLYNGEQENVVHKLAFVFELNYNNDEGKHMTMTQVFTASMHPKSKLRPFIEQWRGKPYTDDEVVDFDTDNLVGKYVILNLQKRQTANGKKRTEIFSIRNARGVDYFPDIQCRGFVPEFIQDMIDNQLKPQPAQQKQSAPVQMQFGGDTQNFPEDIPF